MADTATAPDTAAAETATDTDTDTAAADTTPAVATTNPTGDAHWRTNPLYDDVAAELGHDPLAFPSESDVDKTTRPDRQPAAA